MEEAGPTSFSHHVSSDWTPLHYLEEVTKLVYSAMCVTLTTRLDMYTVRSGD